ncbi:MAG: tetratricopeptide repeat protein [Caldilineaceae bacterium]
MIVMLLALAGCGGRAGRLNEAGNEAFGAGDYAGAQGAYEQAMGARNNFLEAQYNLGNSLFRQNRADEAEQVLADAAVRAGVPLTNTSQAAFALAPPILQAPPAPVAMPAPGATPALGARAWFNLGNVHFAGEEWEAAADAYRQALRLAPDDLDAKVNLELTLRRIQPTPTPTPSPTPEAGSPTPTPSPTLSPTPTPAPDVQDDEGSPTPEPPTPEPPTPTPSPTPSPTPTPAAGDDGTPAASPPSAESTPDQAAPTPAPPSLLGGQPMTPEQALRLLEAAAAETNSLQQELQEIAPPPTGGDARDW